MDPVIVSDWDEKLLGVRKLFNLYELNYNSSLRVYYGDDKAMSIEYNNTIIFTFR